MTGTRRLGSALFATLVMGVVLALLAPVGVAHADPTPAQDRRSDRHAEVTLEEALGAQAFGRRQYSTYLCYGYRSCKQAGFGNRRYRANSRHMYWAMYSGHNCTNYAAYRMVQAGMPNRRPWSGTGNAYYWGRAMRRITDDTPIVGAVAWWRANAPGAGSNGHVAYVEKVISNRKIIISEDSWSGDFSWRRVRKRDGSWPSGFIHFKDVHVRPTTQPTLVGTPQVGVPLRIEPGRWTPSARVTRRWYVGGRPVPGATGMTFTPTPSQVRQRIVVRFEATASGYRPGHTRTAPSIKIHRGDFEVLRAPGIHGTPQVGQVLSLDRPEWSPSPDSTSVQWYAGGRPVPGATHAHFRVRPELVHLPVSVRVTAHGAGYHALTRGSERTSEVRRGQFEVTRPFALEGRTRVGQTLTVARGAFTPSDAHIGYTWLRDGKVIDGADAASYTITPRDLGHALMVEFRLHRQGYQARTRHVRAAQPVTTRPHLDLTTTVRRHTAVIVVRAAAAGVDPVRGPVTLRIDGREITRQLSDGQARWKVRHLAPGRHPVRVDYTRTGWVEARHATTEVRIVKHRH